MAKILIKKVGDCALLYRYTASGIAVVEDGSTGNGHSPHPNIDATGSVRGMRSQGYWKTEERVVRAGGAIYNIDRCRIDDEYDQIAADNCRCGGNHGKTEVNNEDKPEE